MPIVRFTCWLTLCALTFSTSVCMADEAAGRKGTKPLDEVPSSVPKLRPVRARTEQDLLRLKAATMVMEGRICERRGESERALQRYQRAFRLDPEARVVLKQIVPLALELGRVGVATRYAVLLAASDVDDSLLAERLAMFLSDQTEYEKSLRMFERVLRLQAREPQAANMISIHFEMGRLYFLTQEYALAASSFKTVLRAIDNPERNQVSEAVRDAMLADPGLTYNLMAECFLAAGEFDDAAALFTRAAEQQPMEGWLPLQLARVDMRAGRPDEARRRIDNYRQQRLQFAGREPYRMLCELLRQEQPPPDEGTIIERFRHWLGEDPENLPLLTFVAELCQHGGVLDEAAQLYETSIQQQPTIDAYRGLTAIYRRMGNGEKLLEVLGRVAAELQGLEPLADELREIIKDRELLKRLFDLGRQRIAADVTIGRGIAAACGLIALDAREFEVADEFLTELRRHPDSAQLWMSWGLELLMAGESARAVRVFQEAIDANAVGDDPSIFMYYLAGALQLNGQTEPALKAAREALAMRADVPEFAQRPAWILYHAGRYAAAEQAYLDWLKKFGDDYNGLGVRETVRDARFTLSSICVAAERLDQAVEWLELVLDEFPEDVGAMNDLGYLLADQGLSLQRALGMVQKAVEREPENVAYRDSLGWAFYQLGRYEEAVKELKLAVAKDAPDPLILDHLADAQMAVGNQVDAIRAWRQAWGLLKDEGARNQKLRKRVRGKLDQLQAESN